MRIGSVVVVHLLIQLIHNLSHLQEYSEENPNLLLISVSKYRCQSEVAEV
jgi:hypothetical protein